MVGGEWERCIESSWNTGHIAIDLGFLEIAVGDYSTTILVKAE
jgi:hypothetical protein